MLAEPKLAKVGGARRDRTADLLHAMQALSQLSYGPLVLADEPGGSPQPASPGDSRGAPFFTDQD